jgi:hypothetical protein
MKTKKHIDKFFQEKLSKLEATPNESVWENISAELNQNKKDRKVIPFWIKLAGVAAGLVLLLTIGNVLLNDSNITQPKVVDTKLEKDAQKNTNNTIIDTNSNNQKNNVSENSNTKIDDVLSTKSKLESNNNLVEKNKLFNQNNENSKNVVSNKTPINSTNKQDLNLFNKQKTDAIITSSKKTFNNTVTKNSSEKNSSKIDKVVTNENQKNNVSNKTPLNSSNKKYIQLFNQQKADELITNTKKDIDSKVTENTSEENTITPETETTKEEDKLSITEELEKHEEEDILKNDLNINRWSVSSNVAPVYFNSLGSGSSIDEQFNNNSKTGDINMSYGIGAAYVINDKLSVRAGINQVKLSYSTNNVIVFNNIDTDNGNGKPLRNVNLNQASQELAFLSADGFSFAQVPDVVAQTITSSIDQKVGFIEIPVELEYKLSDKKLGINVIGGFSALFLNENEVSSTLQGDTQVLGEATNINKTSFSANLGLGLNYKMSEKFNLNLEPVFKYQLNTFNNTSGNFKPYFIGVYTGLSFKF